MKVALLVGFAILLVKLTESYTSGFVLIFLCMRIISAVNYCMSRKVGNTRSILEYIFFVPALLTGPHTEYAEWKNGRLTFDSLVFTKELTCIFRNICFLLMSGIALHGLVQFLRLSIEDYLLFPIIVYIFLYIQFSLASNIVISISKIFSAPYSENFDRPLLAVSVTDFWNRWHISLRKFLSSNVHSPILFSLIKLKLGRNLSYSISTLYVFILLGVWHMLTIEYFIFGLYFGVILIMEKFLFQGYLSKTTDLSLIERALRILYTQIAHLVGFCLVAQFIFEYVLLKVNYA